MSPTKTLGILHTSLVLVELLHQHVAQHLPGIKVINIVDDSLIGHVREHGINDRLNRRIKAYLHSAVDAGADVVLSACSSVGEVVELVRGDIPVPILRIDDAMADQAITAGRRIGIFATAKTTFGPTTRLLHAKAKAANVTIETSEVYCAGGFELLLEGKTAEHDRLLVDTVLAEGKNFDVVLFAQASMSRLVPLIAPQLDRPILSSPSLAMERLRELLQAGSAIPSSSSM